MQLFPRDGHRLASLQILHTARDLFIPSRLNGSVALFETIEQGVSQCAALIHWQRKCAFQEIGDLWTHGVILPRFRSSGCRKSPAAVARNARPAHRGISTQPAKSPTSPRKEREKWAPG